VVEGNFVHYHWIYWVWNTQALFISWTKFKIMT
jgi:hypothetical protein